MTAARHPGLGAVSAVFVLFGAFWGSLAVSAADIQRFLGLTHAGLGMLLSGSVALAAVANALGGSMAERVGTRRLLAASLAVWGVLAALAPLDVGPVVFGAVLVAAIATGGLVDVVMNVAATAALAGAPGKLVRFHARFNAGAAVGAAGSGALLALGLTWRWIWVVVAAGACALAAVCLRTDLPAGAAGERMPLTSAVRLLRREGLILVAVSFALGAMVEGGVEVWGVLFLRTHLPEGLAVGATSAVLAYSVAGLARVTLGPLAASRGTVGGVGLGALLACVGMLVVGFAPFAWLSGAGLVAAAAGISMYWPLLLAHASAGRQRPGTAVGGVSSVGYLGFVAGPALVGWVSSAAGLRGGLVLVACAALLVAAGPALSRR